MADLRKPDKTFIYEGKTIKGAIAKGEVEALNIQLAKAFLKKQGIIVSKLKQKSKPLFDIKFGISRASSEDITIFTRQMATMNAAGIPLVKAFEVIEEGVESDGLRNLIKLIKADVEAGSSFSQALKKHNQYFNNLYCNLVESGEQSGSLDTMLNRLAIYRERTESLKRKIKKAMFYPIAVLVVATIVTMILLIKVVPTFQDMFKGFGAELPFFTQVVINISEVLQEYYLHFIVAFFSIGYLLVYLYNTSTNVRNLMQRFFLKIPIVGVILTKSIIANFARTLSITFAAGVPLTQALTSVAKAAGNVIFVNAINEIRNGVANGQQMFFAMKKTNVFPNMVVQMISIGEESGSLDKMLERVANIYEEEVNVMVDSLTTLLEPIIMVVLGVIVGGLVISMYLPIFKLGSVI